MKNKINLQRFASDPVQGSKIIYLLRVLSKMTEKAADIVAFQSEGTTSRSKDADTVKTKDGVLRVPGALEVTHSLTSLIPVGNTLIDELKEAQESDDPIEVWRVNCAEKGTDTNSGKYKAEYSRGYLTSVEESANAEDFAELSLEVGVYGTPRSGYVTLTKDQEEMVQYIFQDVAAATKTE
ncbi:phage major tail protein, TP901-1 family [Ileibacterium valens]|uniref:phage major tail protein, TP901-1 family n=1 Tax=Ileibacterium valens TaxID=1862668 RepID=UPI0024B88924|nr:phage major tail protein, TP901-1 family [Ileibacterium valens]